MAPIPPLRAHDYYGRDPKLRMAKAALQPHRRRVRVQPPSLPIGGPLAVDPPAQPHVQPGPRAETSSSSLLDIYTPWRDEANGIRADPPDPSDRHRRP